MVYTNRFYGVWDYGSPDNEEIEDCCELIKKLISTRDNENKDTKTDICLDKNTTRKPDQNYTINLDNFKTINRKQYRKSKKMDY